MGALHWALAHWAGIMAAWLFLLVVTVVCWAALCRAWRPGPEDAVEHQWLKEERDGERDL